MLRCMSKLKLKIHDLHLRHPGVSLGIAGSFAEAGSVCMNRHHSSPSDFQIQRSDSHSEAEVEWLEPDDKLKKAWANEIDTTESGAYGLALAAIEVTDGLVAVSRCETGTGADYYLCDQEAADLEQSHRFEVSGVDRGGASELQSRMKRKLAQALAGNSNVPAIAAVVGFAERKILIKSVDVS